MANKIGTDSSQQRFVDISEPIHGHKEHIRVTFIPAGKAGYTVDSIRLQIRASDGHLRQGPEIPTSKVGEVYQAIIDLLNDSFASPKSPQQASENEPF